MKKLIVLLIAIFTLSLTTTSCKEKKSTEEKVEEVAKDVKEKAEDVGDAIKEGAEKVKDSIEDEDSGDDNQ